MCVAGAPALHTLLLAFITNGLRYERADAVAGAIVASDDPTRDIYNSVVALENLGAATHQTNSVTIADDDDASLASLRAATLEPR